MSKSERKNAKKRSLKAPVNQALLLVAGWSVLSASPSAFAGAEQVGEVAAASGSSATGVSGEAPDTCQSRIEKVLKSRESTDSEKLKQTKYYVLNLASTGAVLGPVGAVSGALMGLLLPDLMEDARTARPEKLLRLFRQAGYIILQKDSGAETLLVRPFFHRQYKRFVHAHLREQEREQEREQKKQRKAGVKARGESVAVASSRPQSLSLVEFAEELVKMDKNPDANGCPVDVHGNVKGGRKKLRKQLVKKLEEATEEATEEAVADSEGEEASSD
jgi:hypothetical protein